jgi:hypothetical protein
MLLAALVTHDAARPSRCALSALRGTSDDETMTTPGGAGTPPKGLSHFPLGARLTGFYHGVGASWSTWLRPFALPRSYAAGFSYVQNSGVVYIRNIIPIGI